MFDKYERLHNLMLQACDADSQIAEHRTLPHSVVVSVEMVNGVPIYFVGDDEVTASQAIEALEAA